MITTKEMGIVVASFFIPFAAHASDEITDPSMVAAFQSEVNKAGYNCPSVVAIYRLNYQDEFGRPFMVACSGSSLGISYRVTVNPVGLTRVAPWK
jgi:hypothetical protein